MPDLKTILLVFGITFLVVLLTRKAIQKQRKEKEKSTKTVQANPPGEPVHLTEEQFSNAWKSVSYLLLIAALGNLFMAYQAVRSAIATGSYILWIDAGLSVVAAVVAYIVWRKRNKPSVYAYMIVIFIPIAFFMSTGYYQEAVIRLFPLVLIYFVVKPVWDNM